MVKKSKGYEHQRSAKIYISKKCFVIFLNPACLMSKCQYGINIDLRKHKESIRQNYPL